ncbi:uncharacterized protein METZ01_LOCUS88807 [marine metagenome]|uniref:Uncharacterized protein n=1 Tax=marine metagenome TaxID=408172 RepID=A0A381V9G7_9ZZZZ
MVGEPKPPLLASSSVFLLRDFFTESWLIKEKNSSESQSNFLITLMIISFEDMSKLSLQ